MNIKTKYKPVRILPFELYHRDPFIAAREQPDYNPRSQQYLNYWTEEATRSIEGFWELDQRIENGIILGVNSLRPNYRWMPGNLYFQSNYTIFTGNKAGNTRGQLIPDLRDTEWMVFYDLAVCDGFSGFEHDEVYTAYRPVGDMEKGIEISNSEKLLIKSLPFLRTKTGQLKKYKPAMEMLYETYEQPMGTAIYQNEALNYMILSSRRVGKTTSITNGVVTYDFTFNGARTIDQYLDQETESVVVVGSADSSKSKEFFKRVIATYDYLRTGVGNYSRDGVFENGVWWAPYDGSILKENSFVTNRVKIEGGKGYTGAGSQMVHVSYNKDASKGVGFAGRRMVVEEVGLLNNFEAVHGENNATQKTDTKFGYSIYIGTGGDIKRIKEVQDAFYNPAGYEMLELQDIFSGSLKPIARFIPCYYYKNQYRDDHGNQDYVAAYEDEIRIRNSMKMKGGNAYLRHMVSFPIVPGEMFMQVEGNLFPIELLEEVQEELDNLPKPPSHGQLTYIDHLNTEVEWIEDVMGEYVPIHSTHSMEKTTDKRGAIVCYEHPKDYKPEPKWRNPMYLTFYDTVKNDTGTSYCYAFVFKFYDFDDPNAVQFNIVAEWFGRYDGQSEKNHEQVFKMAAYYNSKIFPEINNDDIKSYARTNKKWHMLQPQLSTLEGLGLNVVMKKDYQVGFFVGPGMISPLEDRLNELLRMEISRQESVVGSEIIIEKLLFCQTLNSKIIVDQLINYNKSGNFDAVSAMMLLAVFIKAAEKPADHLSDEVAEDELTNIFDGLLAAMSPTRN